MREVSPRLDAYDFQVGKLVKESAMPSPWWLAAGTSLLLLAATLPAYVWWKRNRQAAMLEFAQKSFRLKREHLEAKFFELAGNSGKPRGLEWVGCDFENDVTYARDRESGELNALVGVTIRFAAIEGGGMEEVEAVGNLRAATAVFQFRERQWRSDGRAIFNLNPAEAIRHFHTSLESLLGDHTDPPGRVASK
jgi:hypothetical protein